MKVAGATGQSCGRRGGPSPRRCRRQDGANTTSDRAPGRAFRTPPVAQPVAGREPRAAVDEAQALPPLAARAHEPPVAQSLAAGACEPGAVPDEARAPPAVQAPGEDTHCSRDPARRIRRWRRGVNRRLRRRRSVRGCGRRLRRDIRLRREVDCGRRRRRLRGPDWRRDGFLCRWWDRRGRRRFANGNDGKSVRWRSWRSRQGLAARSSRRDSSPGRRQPRCQRLAGRSRRHRRSRGRGQSWNRW
jgi:hypothetical protein